MEWKSLSYKCVHPNKKDESKPYYPEAGKILMPAEVYEVLKRGGRGYNLRIVPNDNPFVDWVAFAPTDSDDPGDGKGGKW